MGRRQVALERRRLDRRDRQRRERAAPCPTAARGRRRSPRRRRRAPGRRESWISGASGASTISAASSPRCCFAGRQPLARGAARARGRFRLACVACADDTTARRGCGASSASSASQQRRAIGGAVVLAVDLAAPAAAGGCAATRRAACRSAWAASGAAARRDGAVACTPTRRRCRQLVCDSRAAIARPSGVDPSAFSQESATVPGRGVGGDLVGAREEHRAVGNRDRRSVSESTSARTTGRPVANRCANPVASLPMAGFTRQSGLPALAGRRSRTGAVLRPSLQIELHAGHRQPAGAQRHADIDALAGRAGNGVDGEEHAILAVAGLMAVRRRPRRRRAGRRVRRQRRHRASRSVAACGAASASACADPGSSPCSRRRRSGTAHSSRPCWLSLAVKKRCAPERVKYGRRRRARRPPRCRASSAVPAAVPSLRHSSRPCVAIGGGEHEDVADHRRRSSSTRSRAERPGVDVGDQHRAGRRCRP